jgi:ArsR family transcriptional regulator, arsenate/arsenite/antimonite-responsive transcriptional repressor
VGAQTLRFADMFAALGSEARLGILRLLLTSHPHGMVAGEIQSETGIAPSTLSHHLERLKHEGLVSAQREGVYLRYSANAEALTELLSFLYEECCTRSQAVSGAEVVVSCKPKRAQK